jgi:glycosyltransferase involved in cell wall biosynthesis
MAAADVLLLPNTARHASSARYTSPLKLFAYMTSGKPIVASDLPSLRDILNEQNAVLVAADDAQALAEGVVRALSIGSRLAEQARHDVEPFTWDNRATRVISTLGL